MKFLRYIAIIISLPYALFAQQSGSVLPALVGELATYVPTSTPVNGQKYVFPGDIYSYYTDAAKNEIIVVVKKEKEINIGSVAEIYVFDMSKALVKWSTSLNSMNVYVTNRYILSSEGNNTRCYDRASGKQLWKKTDANITYIDEQKGLVLTDYIRALDLQSGKVRWQKYMPARYKWEDIKVVDDSSVIVASGGLYRINLYTGKGWNTNEITGKDEFEIPSAIGIVPGSTTFPVQHVKEINSQVPPDRGTTSNIVTDEDEVYIATNKRLLSVSKADGTLRWITDLPWSTGISSLYTDGDQLHLVAHGKIADRSGTGKKYGKAYIATYSRKDGNKLAVEDLGADGAVNQVMAKPGGDKFLLLFDKAIYAWKESKKGRFSLGDDTTTYRGLADEDLFCQSLRDNYKDGLYLVSSRNKLSYFDWSPTLTHFSAADAMVCKTYGNYTVQYNGANSVVRANEEIIKTPKTNMGFVHNDKLYILTSQSLSVIPIAVPK